jgi:hypothetical protein
MVSQPCCAPGLEAEGVKNHQKCGRLGHDSLMALHSIMFFRQPCRALAGKHPPTRLAAIEMDGAPTLMGSLR